MRCTENVSKKIGVKPGQACDLQTRNACACPRADGRSQSPVHRSILHELFWTGNGGTTDSRGRNGRSILFANDEHDFFRLYFFTIDLADLEQILHEVEFPGDVVAGYLTKAADEKISAAFQQSGFRPIATYCRMITYRLPLQRPNSALEYALPADVDQLYEDLFKTFNRYTDHLPTKSRLHEIRRKSVGHRRPPRRPDPRRSVFSA